MTRTLLLLITGGSLAVLPLHGQPRRPTLTDYIAAAKAHSPLISDNRHRVAIDSEELMRLKALYTHSRLELTGDYLAVPVVTTAGGRTAFKWAAQDASSYYGYDLGESSSHLHAGVTWTQPLLGRRTYKAAQEQAAANVAIARNNIRLEAHRLERTVTEQYLLCLLDKTQMAFTDTVATLLTKQEGIVRKLVGHGLSKQSDLRLLAIEQEANEELRAAARQSCHTHLMDLNLLCGISDTADVTPADVKLTLSPLPAAGRNSLFTEQYRLDSLSTAAALRSFNLQYKPQLNLFVTGGLQVGAFKEAYRHLGWSAGLTFSWTIFDGKQRQRKARQAEWQWRTIRTYRDNAELERQTRLKQCLDELAKYDERAKALARQQSEYEQILSDYSKELSAGRVSVLDYLTVLRNKVQAEKDLLLLQTNKQLVIAAYNYWNQ